jgi:hypothetical protein
MKRSRSMLAAVALAAVAALVPAAPAQAGYLNQCAWTPLDTSQYYLNGWWVSTETYWVERGSPCRHINLRGLPEWMYARVIIDSYGGYWTPAVRCGWFCEVYRGGYGDTVTEGIHFRVATSAPLSRTGSAKYAHVIT